MSMPEGGTLFSGTENSTIQCSWGRGGVPCPGAENAHERKGRVQSSWCRGCGSHVLCIWEGVESSSSGVEEGEP